ncbi:hypothetical protein N7478_013054 [Penicillium angulare]|uniref:uncharacterized protein n=1 Tax=Penicillium angulare TaxID=116970 RepID=UPI002541B1D8|nr:uncharacterized protein N7478_013054 [Penicillium angulare]KAJ5256950.1 hypothetical protein N7478_013054 [Penicillium angulare]
MAQVSHIQAPLVDHGDPTHGYWDQRGWDNDENDDEDYDDDDNDDDGKSECEEDFSQDCARRIRLRGLYSQRASIQKTRIARENAFQKYRQLAAKELQFLNSSKASRVSSSLIEKKCLLEGHHPLRKDTIGPLPRDEIVQITISIADVQYGQRYGGFIDGTSGLSEQIVEVLTPSAVSVLCLPSISVEDLMRIEEIRDCDRDAGVYLHILKRYVDQVKHFYLYAGQADDLYERMSQHKTPSFRLRHPSLHCSVWESILTNWTDVESRFVKIPDILPHYSDPEDLQLFMNFNEMLAALAFQTLQPKDLDKILPASFSKN